MRDGNEADRGEDRRDDDRLIEGVHDRSSFADAREERADHGRDDRDASDRDREEVEPRVGERRHGDQHHGDGRDRVRLEEVRRHPGAVADVVADVVGDDGGVPRIVLGDAGLDLADEVGADVRRLRVDPAAQSREHRDQRAAEREADEVVDRGLRRMVEPVGQHPVVAGDTEQAEPNDEQARHRTRAERDGERGLQSVPRGLGSAGVRPHGDVHADEARRRGERRADQEADRGSPAELVVEAEQEERDDRHRSDRQVLPLEVGRGAFLHGARDLAHPLVAGR